MRYAIVESGGKQYKAVEGQTIEVDRLADQEGAKVDLMALLMADGDEVMVGTPTVSGVQVRATILDHFRGDKVVRFKYAPKKRIRVRGGHRQQYTRLMVDFIGRPGETRKVEKAEPKPVVAGKPAERAEKVEAGQETRMEKTAAKRAKQAQAPSAEKAEKPAAKKSPEKKPSAKKASKRTEK